MRQRGKFVVPTAAEMLEDRRQFVDSKVREIVVEHDRLAQMMLHLNVIESTITFRLNQLGLDTELKKIDGKSINITEQFNGAIKSEQMMIAETNLMLYTYKAQVREIERLKEKFVSEYKFSPEDVTKIVKGEFNISQWAKEYVDNQNKGMNEIQP